MENIFQYLLDFPHFLFNGLLHTHIRILKIFSSISYKLINADVSLLNSKLPLESEKLSINSFDN